MARTTVEDVRAILPKAANELLTDEQIQAAIEAAHCVVNRIAGGCAAGMSEDCLKQVETYLAAHFAAVTENSLSTKSEKEPCCGGSVVYGFEFGTGINGTPFGQTANMISGGCLLYMDKAPSFIHLGGGSF